MTGVRRVRPDGGDGWSSRCCSTGCGSAVARPAPTSDPSGPRTTYVAVGGSDAIGVRHRRPAARRLDPAVLPTLAPPDHGVRQRRRARGDRGGGDHRPGPPRDLLACHRRHRVAGLGGPPRRDPGVDLRERTAAAAHHAARARGDDGAGRERPTARPAARLSGLSRRSRPPGSGRSAAPRRCPTPAVLAATPPPTTRRSPRTPPGPGRSWSTSSGPSPRRSPHGGPPFLDPSGADLSTAGSTLVAQTFSGALPAGSGHTA